MDLAAFKAFIQERFIELDPTADISDGGAIDTEVIQPILDFVGASPYDSSAYAFILERLRQFNPDDLIDEGDALADLAAKPLAHIIDPIVQELNRLRNNQSFRYPELLERDAAANLGANLFVDMVDGSYTVGVVRVFFATALSLSVNSTNLITTVNGERFIPAFPQSITQGDMYINRSGSFFYWDFIVRSVDPGDIIVERGEVLSIQGLDAAVRITNQVRFTVGSARETVAEFITRAREALTERSLVTARGATARIRELFSAARAIEIAGMNDIEMGRDVIDYSASGDRARVSSTNPITFPLALTAGVNSNITVECDDGAEGSSGPHTLSLSGTYANIVELVNAINTRWQAAGGIGSIASSWGSARLLVHSSSDVPNDTYTYASSRVKLHTPPTYSAWAALGFSAYQLDADFYGTSGIIISSMPGGILRPNTVFGTFSATEKRFHIGGCTDVYLRPTTSDDAEVSHEDAEDTKFAWAGTELRVNPTITNSSRVQDQADNTAGARPGRPNFGSALNMSFLDLRYSSGNVFNSDVLNGVTPEPGDIITIINNNQAAGTYYISATPQNDPTLSDDELRLNERFNFATVGGLTYQFSPTTRIELTGTPKRRVKISSLHGTRLQCYGAVAVVTWLGTSISRIDTNNFERYGVEVGDTLVIYSQVNGEVSQNAGEYTVLAVAGNQVTLDSNLLAIEQVSFSVFEEGGDALDLPLVRVSSVGVLDTLGAETGITVPYGKPVLVQSRGFSGAREKMEGTNGILSGATPGLLTIPSSYRSFLDMNIKVGDVVRLSHASVFGSGVTAVFRTVLTVTATELYFTQLLSIDAAASEDDINYSIGTPAQGQARLYFQEPVSFEVQHEQLVHEFDGETRGTSTYPFKLGLREDDGSFSNYFVPRSKGVLGGQRIFPALDSAEDVEVTNIDLDSVPSIAQDMSFVFTANLTDTSAVLDFSTFECRKYGLRIDEMEVGLMGDVGIFFPERLLGQGTLFAYTSQSSAEINKNVRQLNSFARIPETSPNTLELPLDFHLNNVTHARGLTESGTLTSASIEGAFGQLEGSLVTIHELPDGAVTPNQGRFRVQSVPAESFNFGHKLQLGNPQEPGLFSLTPTSSLVEAAGRASYDQWVVTVSGASGNYLVGERVAHSGGTVTGTVGYWDSGSLKLYLYDVNVPNEATFAPVGGTWTGNTSGTTRNHSSIGTFVYALPQDGTKKIQFTGSAVAPGFIDSDNPGPWVIDNFVTLYGIIGSSPSLVQTTDAIENLGTWKITAVNTTGTEIDLENVTDPTKDLVNSAAAQMKWVVSTGPRALEAFGVYEAFPKAFPLEEIRYESGGTLYDSRLVFSDANSEFLDYTTGRAYSGVKVPYQLARPGRIRLSSSAMESNTQDGLYYMDVDMVSLGPAPTHNVALDTDLAILNTPDTLRGAYRGANNEYRGEGYVLEVADANFSFSLYETVWLNMCPRILRQGDDDLEENKIILSSKSFGIRYDRSDLVANVDSLLTSDSERVTSASIMARHFTPAFVRLSIRYSGLATVDELVSALTTAINDLSGSDRIEVSDLEGIIHKLGVDFIDQNFAVVALFHDTNRNIVGERSNNFIGGDEDASAKRRATNRTSHFITDFVDFNKI